MKSQVSRNRDSLKRQLFSLTIHNQAQSLDKSRIKELKKTVKNYEADIRELNNTVSVCIFLAINEFII